MKEDGERRVVQMAADCGEPINHSVAWFSHDHTLAFSTRKYLPSPSKSLSYALLFPLTLTLDCLIVVVITRRAWQRGYHTLLPLDAYLGCELRETVADTTFCILHDRR